MLNVIMLSAVMLTVVALHSSLFCSGVNDELESFIKLTSALWITLESPVS
jgi:hypothetical protein